MNVLDQMIYNASEEAKKNLGLSPEQVQADEFARAQLAAQLAAARAAKIQAESIAKTSPKLADYREKTLDQAIADQDQQIAEVAALKKSGAERAADIAASLQKAAEPRTGFGNAMKDLGWSMFGRGVGTMRTNPETGVFENTAPANWGEGAGNAARRIVASLQGIGGHTQMLPGGGKWRSLTWNPSVSMAATQELERQPWNERKYNDQFDPTRARQILEMEAMKPGFGAVSVGKMPDINMPRTDGSARTSTRVRGLMDQISFMKSAGYSEDKIRESLDHALFGSEPVAKPDLLPEEDAFDAKGSLDRNSTAGKFIDTWLNSNEQDPNQLLKGMENILPMYTPKARPKVRTEFMKVHDAYWQKRKAYEDEMNKKEAAMLKGPGIIKRTTQKIKDAISAAQANANLNRAIISPIIAETKYD